MNKEIQIINFIHFLVVIKKLLKILRDLNSNESAVIVVEKIKINDYC